jgi:hypothetical protein
MADFKPFGKIPRWSGSQHVFITEKIDGTNAQIVINEECTDFMVGSRNRWITPEDDNYGFAGWCQRNREAVLSLGKGQHFGEWYGSGIQRGYGLREKRFALFNTMRWTTPEQHERLAKTPIGVVPLLYHGPLENGIVDKVMDDLLEHGSHVAPFGNPEGVVMYLPESRTMFKYTYDNRHKGESAA